MRDLQFQLQQIASEFVASVLAAMQRAPLGDLAQDFDNAMAEAPPAPPPARRPVRSARMTPPPAPPAKPGARDRRHRATAEEVQSQKDVAYAAAKALKSNFSKGDVMKRSNSRIDLGRALSLLVSEGKLIRKGDRRKARYWLK